jgi:hypothetical protein
LDLALGVFPRLLLTEGVHPDLNLYRVMAVACGIGGRLLGSSTGDTSDSSTTVSVTNASATTSTAAAAAAAADSSPSVAIIAGSPAGGSDQSFARASQPVLRLRLGFNAVVVKIYEDVQVIGTGTNIGIGTGTGTGDR